MLAVLAGGEPRPRLVSVVGGRDRVGLDAARPANGLEQASGAPGRPESDVRVAVQSHLVDELGTGVAVLGLRGSRQGVDRTTGCVVAVGGKRLETFRHRVTPERDVGVGVVGPGEGAIDLLRQLGVAVLFGNLCHEISPCSGGREPTIGGVPVILRRYGGNCI